jgi:DNA-binding NarL/FixJ family response regulator
MQSTTRQAFELRDGVIGGDPAGAPDRQVETARAVIVDDNQRRSGALAAALKLSGGGLEVCVVAPNDPALRAELLPADLVLLALGGRDVSALGIGAEAVQRNAFTEVVFYCDDPDAPEVSAAAVLGITRIVPAQHMAAWLSRGGNLLARGACLRRAAAACAAAVPRPPTLTAVSEGPSRLPLPTAEMQFRESYIRFLLGESGSRQEAARRAGVPYRTMCEMIRKLGIGTA